MTLTEWADTIGLDTVPVLLECGHVVDVVPEKAHRVVGALCGMRAHEGEGMSDRLDEIRKRLTDAHERRRLRGYEPAVMVEVGSVLWLLDEVDRLRAELDRAIIPCKHCGHERAYIGHSTHPHDGGDHNYEADR